MDRMLVIVFDTESKAYEGKEDLLALDDDGRISVYACVVISKNADGTAEVEQAVDSGPLGTLIGTSLGSFIGLLGGPTGLAIGTIAGLLSGSAGDLANARVGDDFVADVTKELQPNRFAVVAEVEEDETTPVDVRMEALGGTVLRGALSEVKHAANDGDTARMLADLSQLKAEFVQAHADRKAKIEEKINHYDKARIEKGRERHETAETQAKAKAKSSRPRQSPWRKRRTRHTFSSLYKLFAIENWKQSPKGTRRFDVCGSEHDRRYGSTSKNGKPAGGAYGSGHGPVGPRVPSNSGDHQGNPTRLDFDRSLHHAIQVRTLSDRADMRTKTLS